MRRDQNGKSPSARPLGGSKPTLHRVVSWGRRSDDRREKSPTVPRSKSGCVSVHSALPREWGELQKDVAADKGAPAATRLAWSTGVLGKKPIQYQCFKCPQIVLVRSEFACGHKDQFTDVVVSLQVSVNFLFILISLFVFCL